MKLLYITSLSGFRVNGFMRSAIVAARSLGIDFTMACNMDNADKELYKEDCQEYGIKVVHVDFARNPLSTKNVLAKKQLLELMNSERFDVVHCNTPIGGVLGRICAKKARIKHVIYQAHGFHFWTGGPIKNWIAYYPVERFLARYTDLLVTINQEDYNRAQKFHLKRGGKLELVHGVGVCIPNQIADKKELKQKRKELGIKEDTKVYVSVGELNENKNHETAIRAFIQAKIDNSCYLICGKGPLHERLQSIVDDAGYQDKIKLLGFRRDIPAILQIADVFIFPSYREGLSAALMEAMANGLPCIAGDIRGNRDLLPESALLFDPHSISELTTKLKQTLSEGINDVESRNNKRNILNYSFDSVVKEWVDLYSGLV